MAKMSLLEMTQNILSAMDSDEVNSINDTIESQQVSEIIKETYYDIFSDIQVPERTGMLRIEAVSDLDRPNYLKLPSTLISLDWLKYKNEATGRYEDVYYEEPLKFFERMLNNISTTSDTTLVIDDSGVTLYVKNNAQPTYYTILNDQYLVFDSYDSDYDTTLQQSKTFAMGEVEEAWSMTDGFIPNLDVDLFPLLLSEAKSTCFITLKQMANQKEEQRARRHRVHLQYRKFRDKRNRQEYFNGVNYARTR